MKFAQQNVFNATQYQLSAPFFKFVTGGFWPAAADALWIQTIQKIGSANYSPATLPEAREFYRLASDLDPNFYELYEQGGLLFLFFYENPEAAQEILSKGIQVYEGGSAPKAFWTHPYTLYIFMANVYAFQLSDWPKAKEYFLRAAQVPKAPQYLVQMQEWLQKEGSEKTLARKVLIRLIENTNDPVIRSKYEERLKKYES
jgi:tetratricopeptide (TPR) repeat protein